MGSGAEGAYRGRAESGCGMSEIEKKPCPICGRLISTHKPSWAKHQQMHDRENEKEQDAMTSQTPANADESIPVTPVKDMNDRIIKELEGTKDPVLLARLKRALNVQKRFREAPQLWASETMADALTEHRRVYLPNSFGKHDPVTGKVLEKPEVHAFYGDAREVDADINRGYIPVIENGRHAQTKDGMLAYWIPQEMHEARVAAAKRESDALTKQRMEDLASKKDGQSVRVDTGGVIEEEYSVTTEQVNNG